jgi:hypothetical protein
MFLLYAVLVGLVLGLLLGGRPDGLARLQIRWAPLIVGGMAIQAVLFAEPVARQVGSLGPTLYLASTLLVLAAVFRNWRLAGLPLVALGAVSNQVAILANGGFMPASAAALAAQGRSEATVYSNSAYVSDPILAPLTDIFAMPTWIPLANVFSIGDVILGVGVAIAIVSAMRARPAGSLGTGVARAGGASGN